MSETIPIESEDFPIGAHAPSSSSWLTPPSPVRHQVAQAEQSEQVPEDPWMKMQRFSFPDGKITQREWEGMMAFFKLNPHLRIKRGTPHPDAKSDPEFVGMVFLRYHSQCRNGELWGSEKAFLDAKQKDRAAFKKWRKAKMASDPEFRAKELAKLARVVRMKAVYPLAMKEDAARKAKAIARAQKSRAKRKAAKANRAAEIRAEKAALKKSRSRLCRIDSC